MMLVPRVPVDLVSSVTADGIRLHGALAGPDGAVEAVLGVHGAWGNFYASPVTVFLRAGPARGHAALVMNGRGHDLGGLDDGARSIGLMRERLEDAPLDLNAALDVLREEGVKHVLVVAHSYGCARAAHWLATEQPRECVAAAFLSPAPSLDSTAGHFVDGAVEDHLDAAREAVAEGDPERLIVLRSGGHIPVIAEAGTVMSIWAPESEPETRAHVRDVRVPILVVAGERESDPYREQAEKVVRNAPDGDLLAVDDDHYHRRERDATATRILDWAYERSPFTAKAGGQSSGTNV